MMRSLAERLLERVAQRGRPLPEAVLIDGRSGAGKTTLGRELSQALSAQLVGMDELYPGWGGLASGSASVAGLLHTHTYERYDWGAQRFGSTVRLDRDLPIIVEGCGSLTAPNRAAAQQWAGGAPRTLSVWVHSPENLRYTRAMERDGDLFRPHWRQWAEQEDTHFELALPWSLADEIVQSR